MGRRKKPDTTEAETPAATARPPQHGNGYNPAKVTNFVERIEALHVDIASIMGKAMEECRQVHGDIKRILDEAKEQDGIPKKALKAVVKARALERKAAEVRDDLDGEVQDSFDLVRHALGDLADLPLGADVLAKHTPADTSDPPFRMPPGDDMPDAPQPPAA